MYIWICVYIYIYIYMVFKKFFATKKGAEPDFFFGREQGMNVKMAPKAVTESDEKELAAKMAELEAENAEDDEEDEDEDGEA